MCNLLQSLFYCFYPYTNVSRYHYYSRVTTTETTQLIMYDLDDFDNYIKTCNKNVESGADAEAKTTARADVIDSTYQIVMKPKKENDLLQFTIIDNYTK